MKNKSTCGLFLAGLLAGQFSGCANMFLSGGKITDRDYAKESVASYRVEKCIDLTNNSPSEKPDATLHLVRQEEKVFLFERSKDGTGTLFKNQWTASDGDHYFAWIGATDVGFEYIIPHDGRQAAKRLAYVSLQTSKHEDGTTRPTSVPGVACTLEAKSSYPDAAASVR